MAISPGQIRAARAFLNWTSRELAQRAKLSVNTIVSTEKGTRAPVPLTIDKIAAVLTKAGIEFLGDEGVRLVRKKK
jgi:transcriptional regulator with XRE-family HTH domain